MKTGKITTEGSDYIQENKSSLQLAVGGDQDKDFRPVPGMIRYNDDHEYVELYTANYGWRFLSTEDMLRPEGAVDMESGVMKILQQVKRVSTGTIHIQGGSGQGGIGSYNAQNLSSISLTSPFGDIAGPVTFKGLQEQQGPNFLLFHTNEKGFKFSFEVDACRLTGLPDAQRYNFTYMSFAGIGGYSAKIMPGLSGIQWGGQVGSRGCILELDVKTIPKWSVNPLAETDAGDTDPNYGKFAIHAEGAVYDNANFDAEFSMYFSCKQFKNF
jgi:hypothetical protein